jgi:hypothetical protein
MTGQTPTQVGILSFKLGFLSTSYLQVTRRRAAARGPAKPRDSAPRLGVKFERAVAHGRLPVHMPMAAVESSRQAAQAEVKQFYTGLAPWGAWVRRPARGLVKLSGSAAPP